MCLCWTRLITWDIHHFCWDMLVLLQKKIPKPTRFRYYTSDSTMFCFNTELRQCRLSFGIAWRDKVVPKIYTIAIMDEDRHMSCFWIMHKQSYLLHDERDIVSCENQVKCRALTGLRYSFGSWYGCMLCQKRHNHILLFYS